MKGYNLAALTQKWINVDHRVGMDYTPMFDALVQLEIMENYSEWNIVNALRLVLHSIQHDHLDAKKNFLEQLQKWQSTLENIKEKDSEEAVKKKIKELNLELSSIRSNIVEKEQKTPEKIKENLQKDMVKLEQELQVVQREKNHLNNSNKLLTETSTKEIQDILSRGRKSS